MVGCACSLPLTNSFLFQYLSNQWINSMEEKKAGGIWRFSLEQCFLVVHLVGFHVFHFQKKSEWKELLRTVLKFRRYFGCFSSDDRDDVISSKPQPPPTGFAQPTHPATSKFDRRVLNGKRTNSVCTSTQYSSCRLRSTWPVPTNGAANPPQSTRGNPSASFPPSSSSSSSSSVLPLLSFCPWEAVLLWRTRHDIQHDWFRSFSCSASFLSFIPLSRLSILSTLTKAIS